jgi:hypothetical protein
MIRKRSAYGLRLRFWTRSRSTCLPLRSSGSRYWPSPGWPSGTCGSGGSGSWSAEIGWVLGPDQALSVLAEVVEGGFVDPHHDDRLAGDRLAAALEARVRGLEVPAADDLVLAGDVDVDDLADLGARDPHLLPGDQEAAVVEDRPNLIRAPVVAGRPRREQQPAPGGERAHDRGDTPHGSVPSGTWLGLQSSAPSLPSSRNG